MLPWAKTPGGLQPDVKILGCPTMETLFSLILRLGITRPRLQILRSRLSISFGSLAELGCLFLLMFEVKYDSCEYSLNFGT